MQKSKGKAGQKNFLQYLVDEFILFRRDFFYEIPVAPQILVEKLRYIRYFKKTSSWGRNYEERIRTTITDLIQTWEFEIVSEHSDKNGTYTQNAQANGIISVDDDGTTFIEGKIIMGSSRAWFIVFMLILFLSLIIWQFGSSKLLETSAAILLLILGIPLVWFNMYFERNRLAKLIEEAVESANERAYD